MPYPANDLTHEEGRRFGVYATGNRDVALCFALGAVPDEQGRLPRTIRKREGQPLKVEFVYGRPNIGGKGYLYALDPEGFEAAGGQWVCPRAVTPLEVEEIQVDEYLQLVSYPDPGDRRKILQDIQAGIVRRVWRGRGRSPTRR